VPLATFPRNETGAPENKKKIDRYAKQPEFDVNGHFFGRVSKNTSEKRDKKGKTGTSRTSCGLLKWDIVFFQEGV
jgi:hypothetical protein